MRSISFSQLKSHFFTLLLILLISLLHSFLSIAKTPQALDSTNSIEKQLRAEVTACKTIESKCQEMARQCQKNPQTPQCAAQLKRCTFRREFCKHSIDGYQSLVKRKAQLFLGQSCQHWFDQCGAKVQGYFRGRAFDEKEKKTCSEACQSCDSGFLHCYMLGPLPYCWQKINCSDWYFNCTHRKPSASSATGPTEDQCFSAIIGCSLKGDKSC